MHGTCEICVPSSVVCRQRPAAHPTPAVVLIRSTKCRAASFSMATSASCDTFIHTVLSMASIVSTTGAGAKSKVRAPATMASYISTSSALYLAQAAVPSGCSLASHINHITQHLVRGAAIAHTVHTPDSSSSIGKAIHQNQNPPLITCHGVLPPFSTFTHDSIVAAGHSGAIGPRSYTSTL